MGESLKHIELVKLIKKYVESLPNIESVLVQCDNSECDFKPSKTIDGFIPDIYYQFNDTLIIGEAKTSQDFNREHSIQQYKSYFKQGQLFQGNVIIIYAVPWTESNSMKNLLRRLIKSEQIKFDTLVISDVGKVEKL